MKYIMNSFMPVPPEWFGRLKWLPTSVLGLMHPISCQWPWNLSIRHFFPLAHILFVANLALYAVYQVAGFAANIEFASVFSLCLRACDLPRFA